MRFVLSTLFTLAAASGQPAPGAVAPAAKVTLPADITSLTAIKGSGTVAAGLADGQIGVWNGRDNAAVMSRPHAVSVLAVGATADGLAVLSVAKDGSLARTSLAPGGGSSLRKIDLGTAPTRAAAFSVDGSMLVTGGEFGEIRVFDLASGTMKQQLRGHRTELQVLALRPGSTTLASASAESDLRIWDAASGRAIATFEGDLSLFALAFSPREGTLASGGVDRRMTLRDPATFKPAYVVAVQAPKMVATLAWSPDGRLIALGDLDDLTLSKGGIQIVSADSRATVATLDTGDVAASAVVFAGSSNLVVAVVGRELRAWALR